jgi:hypothetical protein
METTTDNNNKATMRIKKNRDINAPSGEIPTFPLEQFAKFKNTCEKGGKGWKYERLVTVITLMLCVSLFHSPKDSITSMYIKITALISSIMAWF